MKRILLIGNFELGSLESFYCRALQALGVKVHTLDIQTPVRKARNSSSLTKIADQLLPSLFRKPVNDLTLRTMETVRPDVALVFKGMELFPETIRSLADNIGLVVNYNPDHPFQFESKGSGNDYVKKSIPYFHAYISYSSRIAAAVHRRYGIKTYALPFGYDNAPNPGGTLSSQFEDRILFVGAWDRSRAAWLDRLPAGTIDIFGPENWQTKTRAQRNVQANFQQKALHGINYRQSCSQALAHINLLRRQNLDNGAHNMRTFEVPGAGGLLITQRTEEQQQFFEEDREALFFDTPEELLDRIQFCKNNPTVAERIKKNALSRSERSGYDYISRAKELLNILENH